jgi:hypothetical protein
LVIVGWNPYALSADVEECGDMIVCWPEFIQQQA